MSQQLLMEAEPEAFTLSEEYEKFVPRPSYEQYRALEQDILVHGQLEPIKVNPQMVVLDGYTRYQILADRGIRIKYIIITPEDEIAYMISLNIMRRNLNDFQKLEMMYDHYKELKLQQRQKTMRSLYDILYAIKNGASTAVEIHKATGYNLVWLQRMLLEYTNDYSLSRKREGSGKWKYTINARGEAILGKGSPKIVKGVEVLMGKLIGMSHTQVTMGIQVIEGAGKIMKDQLRNGAMTIGNAHRLLGGDRGKIEIWKRDSKIKCKHCGNVAKKRDYELL